jgi:hypothetical protein
MKATRPFRNISGGGSGVVKSNTAKAWVPLAVTLALVVLASCGGGSSGSPGDVLTPISGKYLPLVISSHLPVGNDRFVVGVINQSDQAEVLGAKLHLRFFDSSDQTTPRFELDPAVVQITKNYTHTHADGTVETHAAGDTGAYVSTVDFGQDGTWHVEVSGATKDGDTIDAVRLQFDVLPTDPGIAIGSPVPATKQTILSDVSDIRDIDTSQNPIAEEHNMTVADAITSGRPTVIAFATPAFCQSLVCGPTKEIFDDLYEKYHAQANFIHIEPYDVRKLHDGTCPSLSECAVPATADFKLETEPWVFVVDARGKLSAKFEGITSEAEMEQALLALPGMNASPSNTSG